jgi:hypothetical protein
MDNQYGRASGACSMIMLHGHTARKIEMVHFYVHFHAHVRAYAARTRITMQHGHEHAAWTRMS